MTTTETAKDAALRIHMEIHDLLTEVEKHADSIDPDEVHWGHVGDLGRIARYLRYAAGRES